MKKIIIKSIMLSAVLTLFTFCKNEEKPIEGNENLNDSLSQVITAEELMKGKIIYKKMCQKCHQNKGKGVEGAFPALTVKKNDINSVVNGVEGTVMIAFKDVLSDQEIIDVINYINNSWGNEFGKTKLDEIYELK